ncbi:unnamed protein product [Urochloa humidicola]
MEPLSNVRTIVGIAQDILAAVETSSRNKSRCGKVATRVRLLRDVLGELDDGAEAGATTETTDAAMRSLLEELEEALGCALEAVRRCRRAGLLRALVVVTAGGRTADPLDEAERDIDRCVQDLGLASYVRVARLERRLRQVNAAACCTDDDDAGEEEENKGGEGDDACSIHVHGDKKDAEDLTAIIGVPVCTVVTAGVHEHGHEIVRLPSHGYYGCCNCYCRFSHVHGMCDCWHHYAGCPSDTDSCYSYTQYPQPYPSIFSDDNPNACSII